MKYLIKYTSLLLMICSYSSNDDISVEDECKLTNYKAAQLYYDYFERESLGLRTAFSFNFDGIQLEYDNQNRINKVTGGPILIPVGSNLTEWILSYDMVYDIFYSGNSVNITSAIESFYGDTTNDYTISNGLILDKHISFLMGYFMRK